jgi:D-glycero-D-manno-heptose 1,7-bisphosphate phosphatase
MKSGVFLERDGILNLALTQSARQTTPLTLEDFRINQEAIKPLEDLKAAGLLLFVTTNQPGLSRGYQCRRELDRMHQLLRDTFPIDDIFVCPHDEMDRCPCRKPKAGLLTEAAFKWRLDLDHSFVVSDKWQDADAARLVGATSLLVRSPSNGKGHHDFVLDSLAEIATRIVHFSQPLGTHLYAGAA